MAAIKRALQLVLLTVVLVTWQVAPLYAGIAVVAAQGNEVLTSTAVTVTQTIAAGDLAVIGCRQNVNSTSTVTMTDSTGGSNTWTQTTSGYSPLAAARFAMFYSPLAAQITSATCTWSGAISGQITAVMFDVSGAASASPQDASVNAQNASTTTSWPSGALTTTNANDIAIYALGLSVTQTVTQDASLTLPANGHNGRITMAYKITAGTLSSNTVTDTGGSAANQMSVYAAFKEAAAAAATGGFDKRRRYEQADE